MAAKKKPVPAPTNGPRPYTGFDGYAQGAAPGVVRLRDVILYLNGGRLTHLGTYAKRDAKGKPGQPSVHATGRAVDIGWTDRADVTKLMDWLVDNADALGVEMIADYWQGPWGQTWRCDRAGWKVYHRKTIAGAPGGRWIHLEISPTLAHDAALMDAAITKALGA